MDEAWSRLTVEEQKHISDMCAETKKPNPQLIADEIAACGCLLELQALKAEHSEDAVKAGWRILSAVERERITAICNRQPYNPE